MQRPTLIERRSGMARIKKDVTKTNERFVGSSPYLLILMDYAIYHIPRSITTIENQGVYYTIEVSEPVSISKFQSLMSQHTHTITKVTPNEPRPNALVTSLVYFTLDEGSIFGTTMLSGFGTHSHNGRWMEPRKVRTYYIGCDNQVYDYETCRSYTNTAHVWFHFHKIMLINVRGAHEKPSTSSSKERKKRHITPKSAN